MESILNFFSDNFWATAAIIAALATNVTGIITGFLKPNGVWKQVIAWVVSIGLTVGAYFLNLINIAEPTWLTLATTGFIVGLASNGIYDVPQIRNWISGWFNKLPQQVN